MDDVMFTTLGDPAREQVKYLRRVDSAAEQVRLKILTPGSGQSLTYDAKHAEALAYINGTASETPWIDAEAEALGSNRDAVAQSILTARENWSVIGIRIEAARLKAKRVIEQSTTAAEMYRTVRDFEGTIDGLTS